MWFRKKKEKTGSENLEKKVEQINDKLFSKVQIVEDFQDVNYSAKRVWDYFNTKGKITKIGNKTGFNDKITGSPQMKHSEEDNSFYPTTATFDATINESKYRVIFESSFREELKVTLECDIDNVNSMKDLLAGAKHEVISISKKYESLGPIKNLYEFLKSKAKSMKITGGRTDSNPKMIVDEELGLLPVEAKISTSLDRTNYIIRISTDFNNKVDIECPLDKTDFVSDLLERMSVKKTKEGEKEVKSLDFYVSVGEYHWNMVGGLSKARKELQQYIEWPLENTELFKKLDSSIPKGILLIGPPGNGKTTIAKIIANESKSSFYTVSPKDINSMWVGGTEKNWGRLFNQARADVKKGKTVMIFIDEIDGFYTNRDELDKYSRISFGQFCQEMDGISDLENTVVIAATNKHKILDEALVRRFTKKIYIGKPDAEGRKEILDIYTKKKQIAQDFDIECLINATKEYSGAQLKELCDAATFKAIERYSATKGIAIKDIKGELIKEMTIEKQDFYAVLNSK